MIRNNLYLYSKKMYPMVPSELLAKRRFCIMGYHAFQNYQQIYDVFRDFQESHISHDNRITMLELQQQPKLIKNPTNITINKNGQVTFAEEAAPQGPFTILPVDTNTDFKIINPYTLVSVPSPSPMNARTVSSSARTVSSSARTTKLSLTNASAADPPTINNWTGRWITKEVFNGTVRVSFHVDNPKAYVGLVSSEKRIKADEFKTNFKAGFFFRSDSVFGVIDVNLKHDVIKSNICKIERNWSSTDTFSILYSANMVQYFHNDENIYTVIKKKKICYDEFDIEDTVTQKHGVYVAGAFYTVQATPVTISQITIEEILPSTQPIIEYIENTTTQVLTVTPVVIASLLIQPHIRGKLSASATIVSSNVASMILRIRGDSIHIDESICLTIDKCGTIMFKTSDVYPAGNYTVELLASGDATVTYATLQAMAQLSS